MGGSSGGGVDKAYNEKMAALAEKMAGMGDIYSSIDLKGYRPGGSADTLMNKYYQTGTLGTTISADQASGLQQWNYQGQKYSFDPSSGKMYDSSNKEIKNRNIVATVMSAGWSDSEDNSGGRSAIDKRQSTQQLTNNADSTSITATQPSNTVGLGASALKQPAKYGGVELDANGDPIYTSQTGQTYNASTQGLQQAGTEAMLSLVEPTRDLEYETIQSNRSILPSYTDSTISTNELTSATNRGALSLLPKRIEASNKFIDESLNGVNVNQRMNEASTDTATAFAKTNAARDRSMARMGVTPGSGAFQDTSTANARAEVAARGNARRNAQDENYRRLGAVGLSGL